MSSGTYTDMNLADLPERQLKIEPFRLRLHNGIFVRQDPLEKKKMLLDCIETGLRLSRKSSRDIGTWLTGEAKMLGEEQIYFQFGKASPDNVGYYDEDGKAFLKKPAKKAGHTLICVDVNLQLVGIVPNSKIARKTVAIAKIQETKNAGLKTIKRDTWNFMRWRGMPRFRLPAFLLACLSPARRSLSLNYNPTTFAFLPGTSVARRCRVVNFCVSLARPMFGLAARKEEMPRVAAAFAC